jgi:aspartate kinase
MKFGGSLLGGKGGIGRVAKIVAESARNNELVVVVSALGNLTDRLLEAGNEARTWTPKQIDLFTDAITKTHLDALQETGHEGNVDVLEKLIKELVRNLNLTLSGVSILGEFTPRSRDFVLSFGERLSAPLVASALESRGVKAKAFTGGEAGLITDSSYGEARPIESECKTLLRKRLRPLLSKGIVPVVTGFVAQSENGDVTTLGRGGSDYTATLLGAFLPTDEVWIWTDVDGIMTADPRVVHGARVVKELSYAEAEELAIFGAKNMHPLALGPARLAKIPVRIRNGSKPSLPGTLIWTDQRMKADIVKSISLVRHLGLLTVSGESIAGRHGTAALVFRQLADSGANVLMISQSVSESNISVVLKDGIVEKAAVDMRKRLEESKVDARVTVERNMAVVAAVGAGMKGTPGVAARIFTAVSKAGVNVRMIAQGSSELNISFVVTGDDATSAVNALHAALITGRVREKSL